MRMEIEKEKSKKITATDVIIIGGGLTGLAIAATLRNQKVILLEGNDYLGGVSRAANTVFGPLSNGIRFFSGDRSGIEAAEYLKSLIDIQYEVVAEQPMTFENGGFKAFLGFGANQTEGHDELSYFLSLDEIKTEAPFQMIEKLKEKCNAQIQLRSWVTKINIEQEKVASIVVNGQRVLKADKYIFCGNTKNLIELLPSEAFPQRLRQRISRGSYRTALCLDLFHGQIVTENKFMHMLNGTTEDDIGPCCGRFSLPLEGSEIKQYSQWVAFLDEEATEESEQVAHALKKIKRQIKRAYPQGLDHIVSERILVTPNSSAFVEMKTREDGSFMAAQNFWIASSQTRQERNIVGALLKAKECGCHVAQSFTLQQSSCAMESPHVN